MSHGSYATEKIEAIKRLLPHVLTISSGRSTCLYLILLWSLYHCSQHIPLSLLSTHGHPASIWSIFFNIFFPSILGHSVWLKICYSLSHHKNPFWFHILFQLPPTFFFVPFYDIDPQKSCHYLLFLIIFFFLEPIHLPPLPSSGHHQMFSWYFGQWIFFFFWHY